MEAARRSKAEEWSPARIYLVASGIFLIVIASAGFATNAVFPTDTTAVDANSEHIFGIFETNGWHNLAGMISAAVALGFAARPEWERLGALVKGYAYVAVTAGIAIWGGETFLVASNFADQILHGTLAVTGLVAGYMTRRRAAPRSSGETSGI